ncbi:MAG: alpha/beta hydrolase [Gemmatimonadetes bacterium]|nr:alpha/beta hydrolase [Gemmatimonadota bacterium]
MHTEQTRRGEGLLPHRTPHEVIRRLAWCLMASTCLLAPVARAQANAEGSTPAAWFAAYQRGSRLVQIRHRDTLNLFCLGEGSPTVILESGIGESAYTWRLTQLRLAKLTRTCAYDRAGLGRSPGGRLPRDTRSEVADLEALLRAADVRPPYLLVGHSMGGYNVRLFASRHLRDVAGLVLVDPSVEDQVPKMSAAVPAAVAGVEQARSRARACADSHRTADVAASCAPSPPADLPPEMAAEYVSWYGLTFSQTFQSEIESFLTVASKQVAAERRSLGSMPLIILTRGERSSNLPADQAENEWKI